MRGHMSEVSSQIEIDYPPALNLAIISKNTTTVNSSENFITNYFKQLKADAPGVELMAGGAQIHVHSAALSGLITEVKGSSTLLELFQ